jgi:phosphosulfolactate synthase (CoM biosynthesis protein A)
MTTVQERTHSMPRQSLQVAKRPTKAHPRAMTMVIVNGALADRVDDVAAVGAGFVDVVKYVRGATANSNHVMGEVEIAHGQDVGYFAIESKVIWIITNVGFKDQATSEDTKSSEWLRCSRDDLDAGAARHARDSREWTARVLSTRQASS